MTGTSHLTSLFFCKPFSLCVRVCVSLHKESSSFSENIKETILESEFNLRNEKTKKKKKKKRVKRRKSHGNNGVHCTSAQDGHRTFIRAGVHDGVPGVSKCAVSTHLVLLVLLRHELLTELLQV